MYQDAANFAPHDWELWHNMGLCCMAAKDYTRYCADLISMTAVCITWTKADIAAYTLQGNRGSAAG